LLKPFAPINNTIQTKIIAIIIVKINLISIDQGTAIIVLAIILVIITITAITVQIPETYTLFAKD
jgi:hypothetical protein